MNALRDFDGYRICNTCHKDIRHTPLHIRFCKDCSASDRARALQNMMMPDQDKQLVTNLIMTGLSDLEVGKEVGYRPETIKKYRKLMGLKTWRQFNTEKRRKIL